VSSLPRSAPSAHTSRAIGRDGVKVCEEALQSIEALDTAGSEILIGLAFHLLPAVAPEPGLVGVDLRAGTELDDAILTAHGFQSGIFGQPLTNRRGEHHRAVWAEPHDHSWRVHPGQSTRMRLTGISTGGGHSPAP